MSVGVLSWVLREAPITAKGDLLAAIALADAASHDGSGCWLAVPTIAQMARLSERGARQALRNLEAQGVIEATGTHPRGMTIYRFRLPEASTRVTAPKVADPPATTAGGQPLPGGRHCPGGGQSDAGTPAVAAPEPLRTVSEPTPLAPLGGKPPTPRKVSRERDRLDVERQNAEELTVWAGHLLPQLEPREAFHRVAGAIGVLGRDRANRETILRYLDGLYGSDEVAA